MLVGYGRVGKLIADGIKGTLPLLVVEEGAVGDPGIEHIRGNAAKDDVLAAANLQGREAAVRRHSRSLRGGTDRAAGAPRQSQLCPSWRGPISTPRSTICWRMAPTR